MRSLFSLALFGLLASGCYYDNEEDLYGPACDASVFSYSAKIDPILEANCRSLVCHGATEDDGGKGLLLTYAQVKVEVDDGDFRKQVITDMTMPKDGALTTCERDLIEKWLNAGAPNN